MENIRSILIGLKVVRISVSGNFLNEYGDYSAICPYSQQAR
jgi:hypothetical protein